MAKPANVKRVPVFSNRSILTPIRPAKPGERVVVTIRGVGHTDCDAADAVMQCRVPREMLRG